MIQTTRFLRRAVPIALMLMHLCVSQLKSQCTGCNQSATTNVMPATNNFSNVFCITTGSTLTYTQNFDMNGGTTCVGTNVTFNPTSGNYNGNWTFNNYGIFQRSLTLNAGQTLNNYGNYTGAISLNGGTIVNYNGATFAPSSFSFNSGTFTNNLGGTTTFGASVTVGGTLINNGTLTVPGLNLNGGAAATLGGTTTINGALSNNGTVTLASAITVTGNYLQNGSGITTSGSSAQCNALNISGTIQGQGTYNGTNGLALNKALTPACGTCLTNGAIVIAAPANQINGATLASSANNVNGTITNPGGSPAATHYIVLRRFGAAVTDQPTDFRSYAVGNIIGSSTVVAVSTISTLTFTDANAISSNGCGTYYYAVFPLNSNGTCGTYNRTINATNRSSIVIASVAGAVGTNASVCPGSTSGTLTLTGYTGSVVRWESSVSPFTVWTTIANTTNTYTSGALSQTTQFRAVVNAGTSCSNVNSTAATITIADNTAPVISGCSNQTINLNSSCAATMPNYISSITVSDNCTATGSITVTQSPAAGSSLSGAGVQIVTITATDASANSSSCTFNLTKQDVTAPVISCPSNITTNAATGTCGAAVTYSVTATDNCSGCAPASITGYTLIGTYGGHTYFRSTASTTWATANSNANALGAHLVTITSAGENSFLATQPTSWTGFTDQAVEGTFVWVTGEAVTYTNWNSGEPNNSGGNENYMQINFSGNFWNDNNGSTNLPYVVEYECTGITMNMVSGYASGSTFPVGTTTVIYNATDGAGNTSSNCSFTVTVNDITPPMITCPANISVNAAAGACDAVVTYASPVATDNCGSCSSAPAIAGYTSLGIYNGSAYYISNTNATAAQGMINAATLGAQMAAISSAGENTFIRNAATAAGFTGNYLIGLTDVAVEGTFVWSSGEAVIYTNWNAGEPNDSGGEDYVQVYAGGSWNDIGAASSSPYVIEIACITPVKTSGLASGSTFPLGTSTVNYSATDPSGNSSTCSFTVTVSLNPLSTGRAVSATTNPICINNSTNITVASSDNGVSYQLRDNATNANIGTPVTGTGGTINLPTGNLTATTTFNVYATPPACAGYQLTTTLTVTVNPAATVTAGSTLTACQSAAPSAITLTGASVGGSAATGAWSITSGGGTLSSTAQTASPATVTYTPVANFAGTVTLTLTTNDPAGPCGAVFDTRTITVNTAPTLTPGATLSTCQSSSPSAIVLSGASVGGSATTGAWSITSGGGSLSSTAQTGTPAAVSYTPAVNYSGSVTLTLTTAGGLCGTTSSTRTITVNALPTDKTPAAVAATVCSGTSTNIQITTSQSGVNYQLRNNYDNSLIGTAVAGTTGTINLSTGALASATTFNVLATNPTTTCSLQMSSTVTVNIYAAATVTPGTTLTACQSSSPTAITLTGASVGGSATTGAWSVTSGGGTLSSTAQTATPATVTYTPAANYSGSVTLTLTSAGPCAAASATRTITVNPLPLNKTITAAATTVCSGNATNIQVASSELGVNYQLRNNSGNTNIGIAVAGTGGSINLPTGNLTVTTTFNVLATNATTTCNIQMTGTAAVSMDNIAPVITCPATQTLGLNSSCAGTLPSYTSLATVSDNCTATGSIVVTQSPAAGTAVTGTGTQLITLTATDASGNFSTCNFNVTKQDVTPPVMSCPSNISVNAAAGTCGAVVNYTVSATDNCSGSSCAPSSITGYTLIGTYNGHTYFRSAASTIWPTANTNAAALGAHLVTISSAGENAFLAGIGTHWAGFTDEVTEGTWVWVTGEPVVYTSWAAGEPNNGGGNQDYMVLNYSGTNWDDQGTSTTVTQPYVIEFDCLTTNMVSGLASGSVFPIGTTTVTYNATDQAGNTSSNCSFTVTVTDVTPPTILCPANITATAAAGTCSAIVTYSDPVVSDNCGSCTSAPAITGYTSLGLYNGNAYYISTATANCTTAFSAAASLGASIPTIGSAAENTFLRNAANAAGYTGSYLIGSNDAAVEGTFVGYSGETLPYTNWNTGEPNNSGNEDYTQVLNTGFWNDISVATAGNYVIKMSCITPTKTSGLASGSAFPIGVNTINYSVSDASGNTATCSFTVTVGQNAASLGRTVAAAATPVCTGSGTNITVAASDNSVSFQLRDNATNASIGSPVIGTGGSINLPTGNLTTTTIFNIFATPPACAGYQLTSTVTVTVNPVATVTPGSIISTCQSASPSAITLSGASIGGSASTGAWSITSGGGTLSSTVQTATPAAVTYTPAANYTGTVILTLTSDDPTGPCGAVSATRTITVNPLPTNIPPVAAASNVCPGTGTNIQITGSQTGVNYQLRNNTGNTLIGTAVAGTGGTVNLPTGNLSAATTYNVLATDATTTCSTQMTATATVSMDNTAPVITCPGNQTINLNSSCAATLPSYTSMATVSDNCTATGSIVVTQSPAAGTAISGSGTMVITLTATDATGNTSNCSFNLVKQDVTAPVMSCPSNINATAVAGTCGAAVSYYVTATDACPSCSQSAITGYTLIGTYGGHVYYRSTTSSTWATAKTNAQAVGAHLVTIASAGENTFLAGLGNHWGGMTDEVVEGTWVWVTGEPVVYTSWAAGEPNDSGNQDYLVLNWSGSNWDDQGAAVSLPSIIEFECVTLNMVAGLSSGSTFPVGTTTVTYNATDGAGNTSTNCSFTVTVALNPSSTGKTVSAVTNPVCINTGTNVTVALSDNGTSYQLRDASNTNVGSAVTGTGGTINLPTGNLTATTTFNVLATPPSCTGFQLTNTITVTVNPAATVTPGTTLSACQSSSPSAITLIGASVGGSAATGAWSITSGGGTLSNTTQTATPATVTYTPAANYSGPVTLTLTSNDPAGPCGAVSATRTITINALPTNKIPAAAASSVCPGTGTNIQITTSQTGVNYQLRNNTGNVNIGAAVAGTGGTINFPTGNLSSTTTFNVVATDATTSCAIQMSSTVTVSINALPADKTPTTVSPAICTGNSTNIQIALSEAGVNYQLRNNYDNSLVGSAVAGTTGTINLPTGTLTSNATFNVLATSGASCSVQMVNTVTVTINATGQWVGGTTGDWNTSSNWCGGVPTSSTTVNIPTGTTVNIQSANATAKDVTIASGASIVMTGAYNLNITAGGTFTNSGTFTATASTGTVSFAGTGTISGTTTFKNIDANGALDFGTASTINGTFTIQPGGSVTGHAPTYTCPSSVLLYKPGNTFARGLEWTNGSSGAGYPANVIVQNNTTINFPANGNGYVCYDLQIDAGSLLNQNYSGGSAKLSVGRNVTITGTLKLGGASGGDINVGGSWIRNTGGVFIHNDRVVTFDGPSNFSGNGTSMSTITAPASAAKNNEGGFGGENFAQLVINKTNATDSVVLLSNITVNRELGLTKGTFSLRNNDVTIVSNSTRTADIAAIATLANVAVRYGGTGKFVIQRFIQNPTAVRSWRLLTSPVQSATAPSINTAWQEGVVNPDRTNPNGSGGIYNPWPGYGIHITGPGGVYSAANGFDQGTNSPSILYANAGITTWVNPSSTITAKVTDQQGWMLFVRGDRGFTIGNQYVPSQDGILEPKGRINIGNVAVPVTANKHIIGNPYAAEISLLNVDIAGTLGKNSTYYMWDPKMFTSYTQPGKWVTFTGVGSSFVQTSSASPYATDGTIESGQAFAVDVASAGNITFRESDKKSLSSSLTGIANRPASPTTANFAMFRSDIYANSNGNYSLTDGVLNIFSEEYNNTADENDSKKMITFNTKESLSILRDSVKMAIEKRHDIQEMDTIFFTMSKFNVLPYQFKFTANNFAPGMQAFLEDIYTGTSLPVNTDGETTVDFTINADSLSKAANRFRVVFRNNWIVLPVTFTNVAAWKQNKDIAVQWKVNNELDVRQYEVEKSLDGVHFEKTNTTLANGNSTGKNVYNWLDENAVTGDNFYRIASRSTNNRAKYSQTVKVNIGKANGSVSVYPNPVTGGNVQLKFTNMAEGTYTARLFNSDGQLILEKQISHSGTATIHSLQAFKNTAKGFYNLEVSKNGEDKKTIKVVFE